MGEKLKTERLILRPLVAEDAPSVARLAGRREIADTTLSIPHPYSEQQAREWIAMRSGQGNPGKGAVMQSDFPLLRARFWSGKKWTQHP